MKGDPRCKLCKGEGVVTQTYDFCSEQVTCPCVHGRGLKSLAQHDAEQAAKIYEPSGWGNGIACPTCAAELRDSDMVIVASHPPRRNVDCQRCGWRGTRVA